MSTGQWKKSCAIFVLLGLGLLLAGGTPWAAEGPANAASAEQAVAAAPEGSQPVAEKAQQAAAAAAETAAPKPAEGTAEATSAEQTMAQAVSSEQPMTETAPAEPAGKQSAGNIAEGAPAGQPLAEAVPAELPVAEPAPAGQPVADAASAPQAGDVVVAANTIPSLSAPEPPSAVHERIRTAMLTPEFAFVPDRYKDPFEPFVRAQTRSLMTEDNGEDAPAEPPRPLTPLQRMTLGEIEKGLRAITWGELGRKAVIEDGSGKGYIVGTGTPAGDKNGVITAIYNDRLVIQQSTWDRKAKRYVPQNSIVRLKKVEDDKQ